MKDKTTKVEHFINVVRIMGHIITRFCKPNNRDYIIMHQYQYRSWFGRIFLLGTLVLCRGVCVCMCMCEGKVCSVCVWGYVYGECVCREGEEREGDTYTHTHTHTHTHRERERESDRERER